VERRDEFVRMWNEAIVAYFKVLFRYLPGGTEKNKEKDSQDRWSQGRNLNPGPPEYEAKMTTRQRRSVTNCYEFMRM
jgi:hypothetical protein